MLKGFEAELIEKAKAGELPRPERRVHPEDGQDGGGGGYGGRAGGGGGGGYGGDDFGTGFGNSRRGGGGGGYGGEQGGGEYSAGAHALEAVPFVCKALFCRALSRHQPVTGCSLRSRARLL